MVRDVIYMSQFRFHRRITIIPGFVYLNLSKSGISLTIGKSGRKITFGKAGIKFTMGLPGSGLSTSKNISYEEINTKIKNR